ncbi:mrr restriction system protein [Herbaspirillum rubrisubalbicans M1]|uniref:restriction endonuclease n=1 Tax=Herbaspirillum rubrisubalbicans TaxID=80842 RepID=UPI00073A4174|nr:restriction endonuclease [Herbaspirillum rubrisubalbicans]ALU90038.1 mrr restriction system protein [Herbaspirillum rubrisubalbicans M1]
MGRRSGIEGFLRAAARAAAAAERESQRALRAQATQLRQLERQQRMAAAQEARDQKAAEKMAKLQYLEDRQGEVDDLNAELQDRLDELKGLLAHTLHHDDRIDFASLKSSERYAPFSPPRELLSESPPLPTEVAPLKGLSRFWPGSVNRHAEDVAKASEAHKRALAAYEHTESQKLAKLSKIKREYEEKKEAYERDVLAHNAEVDRIQATYQSKDPEAIVAYCDMVLARSAYPAEGFPQKFRLAFQQETGELVVEYDLPEPSVIPQDAEFRYVKTKDQIESKARKPAEIKQLYQDIVAAVTLRTLHELFEADQVNALSRITFNGMIDTHDPASGKEVRVPVVSVRAPKETFLELRLEKVDKIACLKNLGAQVSPRPDELLAIKPIVEFDMIDKRFIDQGDVLTGLESRPNLLDLTPGEFEILVSNLFGKMGLETKLTRSSRDGGVDAVAYDTRPILGGKVVIQAKRYKDTVGVSAVRDLFGTMMNEGANKGILVCTSGYGTDAYNFCKDKPIELIDGGGLLYLLREHAGIEARIAV